MPGTDKRTHGCFLESALSLDGQTIMDTDHDQHTSQDKQQPPPLTRRDFLKRSSAGLAGASLLLGATAPMLSACSSSSSAPTEIVFAFGPDDTGTLQTLIDAFNRQHEGDIQVQWRKMPRTSDANFQQLQSEFEAGDTDIDVIGADVVWTAEFARHGWVTDLSDRFHDTFDAANLMQASVDAASHQARIWGIPWYSDAGMLYYRRDLLLRNDFTTPPSTWDELKQMARTIQQNEDVSHGFVFQGDAYEGGVTNACEYIWNAGGRIMAANSDAASASGEGGLDPAAIRVDSPEAARGFDIARSMIADQVSPEAVTSFREQDTSEAFLQGDAVFMRNWPTAYGLVDDPNLSTLEPEQVGITTIPAADPDRMHYSCLGGWNLMISAQTSPESAEAAWTFIQFAVDANQQKNMAIGGGFLPTLRALYDDPEVVGSHPVLDLGREAIQNTRPRPASPFYSKMSPRIADAFSSALRGARTGEEATQQLAKDLRLILRQSA